MPLSGHLKIFLNCINNIKQMALQARVFQVWHFCPPLPLFFLCSLALQLFVLPLRPSLCVFSFTGCSLSSLDFCLIPSHARMHTHTLPCCCIPKKQPPKYSNAVHCSCSSFDNNRVHWQFVEWHFPISYRDMVSGLWSGTYPQHRFLSGP